MKTCLLFFSALIWAGHVQGQASKGIYRVKNGTDVSRVIPFNERYQFAKFQDGRVMFRNGKISSASMNYNLVHGEVLFIDANKDTLLFDDNNYVKKIFVGENMYLYAKGHGHVQAVSDFGSVMLGKKLFLVKMGSERYASYDQYSAASAISSYSSFINQNGQFQTLEGRDKVILRRRSVFFLIDKNDRVTLATRPNLLKLFPRNKGELNTYLKDNQTNFEKEEDVRSALEFASRLE